MSDTNIKNYHGGYMKDFKKFGFTLAEVLITLGVIGVVATMTMPTVIQNYQKQNVVSKLKKTYTTLNQALKLSEIDNSEYKYWDSSLDARDYFEKYWKPYLKVVKICQTYSDCGYKSDFPFKTIKGESDSTSVVYPSARTTFILNNGILVIMSLRGGNYLTPNQNVIIDINASNPPNMFGKDVFRFERNEKGLLYPYKYDLSENDINSGCNLSGLYCSAKIMHDGWKISDDYPW